MPPTKAINKTVKQLKKEIVVLGLSDLFLMSSYKTIDEYLKNSDRAPEFAYWYSRAILNDRWRDAEPSIRRSAEFSYLYARNTIGGRWKEAEYVIASSPEYSYLYSCHILKRRWEYAESTIMSVKNYRRLYKILLIKVSKRGQYEKGKICSRRRINKSSRDIVSTCEG